MHARVTVIQPDPTSPIDLFGEWLPELGVQIDLVDVNKDRIPNADAKDLDLGAGLIVLGGKSNAYSTAPWAEPVRALLRRAVADELPTLGICLGHQLLAVALGGEVSLGEPESGEFGPTTIEWSDAAHSDPVVAGIVSADGAGRTSVVTQNHNDWVTALPEGATELAHSDRGLQAFRAGSALGVQFHPEGSPASARDWQHRDREALTLALHAATEPILVTARAVAKGYANQVLDTHKK
ncbi:GMP synthase (glutamine-hydrolyzing) [Trueperella bonasi]|uniref:GMP synthase (Glutamine-hydrolyzing) n=1 Tax=Trueperella bonasi TaxID=312286 RepID=A0ABT9NEN1_9ACTO|nr:type 1 glutamine amidotransferase [Trueperella bonasi]MDP9805853.1 GMP synthase (glutamine-hydrolyzing) [Trueperella bonasi]